MMARCPKLKVLMRERHFGPSSVGLARRLLIMGAGVLTVGGTGAGATSSTQDTEPDPRERGDDLCIVDLAGEVGTPVRASEDFGLLGVFDIDWLLDPRFTRLLDNFAASPGAFRSIRFFGALNSGELEKTLSTSSGTVWTRIGEPPDFSRTLNALSALVARRIIPFVTLSFFPQAVSGSP